MLNRKNAQIALSLILVLLTAICPADEQSSESVSIIPQPVSIEYDDGCFQIGPETHVIAENEAAMEASKSWL